ITEQILVHVEGEDRDGSRSLGGNELCGISIWANLDVYSPRVSRISTNKCCSAVQFRSRNHLKPVCIEAFICGNCSEFHTRVSCPVLKRSYGWIGDCLCFFPGF